MHPHLRAAAARARSARGRTAGWRSTGRGSPSPTPPGGTRPIRRIVDAPGVLHLADERVAGPPQPQHAHAAAVPDAVRGDLVDRQDELLGRLRPHPLTGGPARRHLPQLVEVPGRERDLPQIALRLGEPAVESGACSALASPLRASGLPAAIPPTSLSFRDRGAPDVSRAHHQSARTRAPPNRNRAPRRPSSRVPVGPFGSLGMRACSCLFRARDWGQEGTISVALRTVGRAPPAVAVLRGWQ